MQNMSKIKKIELMVVKEHIKKIIPKLQRKPGGVFKYPWVMAAYGVPYVGCQAFWDAYHECLHFIYDGKPEWMRNMLDNHFYYQNKKTGWIPFSISINNGCNKDLSLPAQPFVCQGALIYSRTSKDKKWLRDRYNNLKAYINFLHRERRAKNGLYFWCMESGCDNDVSTMFYPSKSIISSHASSLVYMEHLAISKISRDIGMNEEAKIYGVEAEKIKDAINKYLWNEEVGCYVNVDIKTGKQIFSLDLGEEFHKAGIGNYSFFTWNYMMPLYARISSIDRAKIIIEKYLLNPEHFWSKYGIRSLSKKSEYYNNAIWGNPARYSDVNNMTASNWQGPIWFPVNYFMFHSLINYGYKEKAFELADKIVKLLADGIREKGYMFENYDAETGKPLYAPYFGSWNILADKMHEELEKGNWIYNYLWKG